MVIDPQAKRIDRFIVLLDSSMCSMNEMFPLCPIWTVFSSNFPVFSAPHVIMKSLFTAE